MRTLLQIVYAAIVIIVIALLAKTCFGVRTSDVTKSVADRAAPIVAAVQSAPAPDTTRPPDADRMTQKPTAEQLLANDSLSRAVVAELSARYQPTLADFQRATEAIGAKLIVVSFGVDGGKHKSELEERIGPVIVAACKALQVPYYEFSAQLDSAVDAGTPVVVDQKDGHLSRAGAAIVAAQLAKVITSFDSYRSTKTFSAAERPATFGDYKPLQNDVIDLGDGRPYLLKVNSQGLRMDYEVRFPKTKQRILFMGSSLGYFPFLDNDKTSTGLLQAKFPNKEILNAAMLAYGLHDELDLFSDKAQFTEPDLVIVQQNGMDVLRSFFTIRNAQDRAKHYHAPSAAERAWYVAHYPAK